MALSLNAQISRWPVAGSFTIARGSVSEVVCVIATISDGTHTGRGECRPYARYGETPEGVVETILSLKEGIASGLTRTELHARLPAGAARNAIDCALWDLEAKQTGKPVWELAGLEAPKPLTTVFTLSLASADDMHAAAKAAASRPILKIKLGSESGDIERLEAVRAAAPDCRLVVDANEGWKAQDLPAYLDAAARLGIELVEQPLPAKDDKALADIARPVPICADESAHDTATLKDLIGLYDVVNVKLDKTGGLTEALAMIKAARRADLSVFVGCMLASSLAMAPAVYAAQLADYVDLDGPLLLKEDCDPALTYEGSTVYPPLPALWG